MNLMTEILVFLAHIDQETILNFFGIADPNTIDPDYQIFYGTIEMAPISTNVSLETLRIIVEAFLEYSKRGLSLVDVENICLFITFVRFILLTVKYNIKTSFCICIISLLAAALWYLHAKDVLNDYWRFISALRIQGLSRARVEVVNTIQNDMKAFKGTLVSVFREKLARGAGFSFDDKDVRSPFDFFSIKFALVKSSERYGHRIDPISMIFSRLPDSARPVTDKMYYVIFEDVLPNVVNKTIKTAKQFLPTLAWIYVTRVGKKYCPYLIRWHWTYIECWDYIERFIFQLAVRMSLYVIKLEYLDIKQEQRQTLILIVKWLFYLEFLFLFYGLVHALFSQYFYIPFLTENTEIHIGPRPKDSIYSGGYTDWQEYKKEWTPYGGEGRNFSGRYPKLWYGWFGTDRRIPQKIKTFFRKFLKKIRKLFFRK